MTTTTMKTKYTAVERHTAEMLEGDPTPKGVLIAWDRAPEVGARITELEDILEELWRRGVLTRDYEFQGPHGPESLRPTPQPTPQPQPQRWRRATSEEVRLLLGAD